MSLNETLKLINSIAVKYLIDKPYIVGGLPRDRYMGISKVKTTDVDLTTNSPEILRLGILTASELNVTFDLSEDGHVTVFADEFDIDFSSNFISPSVLEYLSEDKKSLAEAYSRDFTINTLHQDLVTGEIIDPTGKGFDDMKNKVISTPVPPEITLTDDPRRIYRAINLAARYDFDIDSEIKDFVVKNPNIFSSKKVKDQYIAIKISKALKDNQSRTLKLLKELDLFKNVPLSGNFKDILIQNKLLADYLSSNALDHKKASNDYGDWKDYISAGPEYKELADWWKKNYFNIDGNYNSSFYSWVKWYNDRYHNEWGNRHKGPKEVLNILKEKSIIPVPKRDLSSELEIPQNNGLELKEMSTAPKIIINPGVNVERVTENVKKFIKALGDRAELLEADTPIITSGWRSVRKQANVMAKNWKNNGGQNGGREYLVRIYANDEFANKIADVFDLYGVTQTGIDLAVKVIQKYNSSSHHIKDPAEAIDLAVTRGIQEVLFSLKNDGLFKIKIVDETNTAGPHYHVAILG